MKGDITLTVRLNPLAQGHLSKLMELNPEKSRNKVICQALENISTDKEEVIKKLQDELFKQDSLLDALKRQIRRKNKSIKSLCTSVFIFGYEGKEYTTIAEMALDVYQIDLEAEEFK
jgi:hypothetical protein